MTPKYDTISFRGITLQRLSEGSKRWYRVAGQNLWRPSARQAYAEREYLDRRVSPLI